MSASDWLPPGLRLPRPRAVTDSGTVTLSRGLCAILLVGVVASMLAWVHSDEGRRMCIVLAVLVIVADIAIEMKVASDLRMIRKGVLSLGRVLPGPGLSALALLAGNDGGLVRVDDEYPTASGEVIRAHLRVYDSRGLTRTTSDAWFPEGIGAGARMAVLYDEAHPSNHLVVSPKGNYRFRARGTA